MKKRALIILLLFVSGSAQAAVYSYVGNNYASVTDNSGIPGAYTTAMSLSGTFTTAAPLADTTGIEHIELLVLSYSFFDGRTTFTDANSTGASFQVQVVGGNIVQWDIDLEIDNAFAMGGDRLDARTQNTTTMLDSASILDCIASSGTSCTQTRLDQANVANLPGTFSASVVPIPAAAWLLGSGLLALLGLNRRKRVARGG